MQEKQHHISSTKKVLLSLNSHSIGVSKVKRFILIHEVCVE